MVWKDTGVVDTQKNVESVYIRTKASNPGFNHFNSLFFSIYLSIYVCFMKGVVKSSFWDIGADVRCSVGRCVSVFCPSFL